MWFYKILYKVNFGSIRKEIGNRNSGEQNKIINILQVRINLERALLEMKNVVIINFLT
jgi:hypothetical protein